MNKTILQIITDLSNQHGLNAKKYKEGKGINLKRFIEDLPNGANFSADLKETLNKKTIQ